MTMPKWGEFRWGDFIWGGIEPLTGHFEIDGEDIVLRFKLADVGKLITGGTVTIMPEVENE